MSPQPDITPRAADRIPRSEPDLCDVILVGALLTRALHSTTGVTLYCTPDLRGRGPYIGVSVDTTATTAEQRAALAEDLVEVLGAEPYTTHADDGRVIRGVDASNWRQTGVIVSALVVTYHPDEDTVDEAVAA
ncbi:4-oxalocrotonate tautomerase family protein [Nocardiopsis sp. NPDC101807]|uniref:tautomerase family protein n=1 Tax=Nocardiopsis sp. NPDC101807 TaxID=3364339 RepID=UPI0037F83CD4